MRRSIRSEAKKATVLATALLLAIGSLAHAEAEGEGSDCTWFPDLRCGRSGRPAGFEMPVVQPYLFEDPFVTTNLVPYYVWHEFPDDSALQGGDAHVLAVQARVALTDRIALIATKDGYMWSRPDNPLLGDENGFMNLAAGLKYMAVQNHEQRFYLSGILRAEFSTGSTNVFAGGDGVQFLPSLAAAWEPIERLHLIGDLGGIIPTRGDEYTSQIFWHVYLDYAVHKHFQPFLQFSGLYYVDDGAGERPVKLVNGAKISLNTAQAALGTGPFDGVDVTNMGSMGMDNANYITAAIGTHIPITDHVTFSVAYERPITNRKDITEQRVTTAFNIEF
jgi:hypothetical protein